MVHSTYDEFEIHRAIIRRLAATLSSRHREVLDSTEELALRFDSSGLGIRIGIRSIRARQLFKSLQQALCPSFEPHLIWYEDDGVVWARYGFREGISQ